jgi:hypothetical protein
MSVSTGLLTLSPDCLLIPPEQGSVGLVSRFGQFYKSVDPGLVKVNVCSETIRVVGMSPTVQRDRRARLMDRCQDPVDWCSPTNGPDQG